MKVALVVASGAHQGKTIPVTGAQFLIGRDAQCHLRPASQAISKRHCGILIRDGKVYVKDFGSTNGTTINDQLVKDAEVLVESGASLKIGPLDFTIQIEKTAIHADGTPLPSSNPETAAALAAVTAATGAAPKAPPSRDTTPNPARPAKPVSTGSKEAAALKEKGAAPAKPATAPAAKPAAPSSPTGANTEQEENDRMAAMLLGMDDGKEVPDGSTVMDIPTPLQPGEQSAEAKADEKDKKKVISREDMTNAASDILRKMMRRPK
jgi:predicted component of type VI protein secretion system